MTGHFYEIYLLGLADPKHYAVASPISVLWPKKLARVSSLFAVSLGIQTPNDAMPAAFANNGRPRSPIFSIFRFP